ncbi:Monosaccharide-transporting ATPase [Lentibacillus sp. JNUCC-1]|uniref:ABC transporter ATP-binding protein n=1 Tax=Lentibacillus sp. JNUCC-1 TaxID=2654513 RepID=UPI0012E7D44C|nr:ABC transporter ATP-binding protein [Lentibacillus sp. JNUCC-1]MUV37563.1 Monosaccharide-transporting ATPase [Lentibacillus sp. JNUCC-1]
MHVKDISKMYGKQLILDDIDLDIKRGVITGLIGKNGAGKTTLMKVLCQIIQKFDGQLESRGQTLGYLIEHPKAYQHRSGGYNIVYFSEVYGVHDLDYVNYLLETLGMKTYIYKKVRTYSMGMKQKLGIVLSMLKKPHYLILDEPTNGMDPDSSQEVLKTIKHLAEEFQMGVLISSHKLEDIEQVSDEIVFIDQGVIESQIEVTQLAQSGSIVIKVHPEDKAVAISIAKKAFEKVEAEEMTIKIPYTEDMSPLLSQFAEENVFPKYISTEKHTLKDHYFNMTKQHGGVAQ